MNAIGEAHARLRAAPWLVAPETQAIFAALDGAQGRTRIVGGVVRDTILDRPRDNPDIDMATELLPDTVIERANAAGMATYPTGIAHGTVTLKLGNTLAEVTTLRRDVTTDGRHAVVQFGTDWHEDASRRDFTLNALYVGMDGTLFDPLGGLDDCLASRVRFIGSPEKRIAEDGLRVYRFFRFGASHGNETFYAKGLASCRAAAPNLGHLSAERVGGEMARMLTLPHIAITLRTMAQNQLLDWPDTLVESLRSYERVSHHPSLHGRLALMLDHLTPEWFKIHWRLANAEIAAAQSLQRAAALLQDYSFHEAVHRYPDLLCAALEVAAVKARWTSAGRSGVSEKLASIEKRPFPITGDDLLKLGLLPGPRIGHELSRLEELWIESSFSLDRQDLLAKISL